MVNKARDGGDGKLSAGLAGEPGTEELAGWVAKRHALRTVLAVVAGGGDAAEVAVFDAVAVSFEGNDVGVVERDAQKAFRGQIS